MIRAYKQICTKETNHSAWHLKWANANNLKLNDSKTEVIHITSRFRRRLELPLLIVESNAIGPTDKVMNLDHIFDRNMIMDQICFSEMQNSFLCSVYKIGKIRQFLDTKTIKNLVQALVLCHLNYCNNLLFNMPYSQIREISTLQLIQNSAARLITGCRKFSHITPVVDQVHWLPVQVRINFKQNYLHFSAYMIWPLHTWNSYLFNLSHLGIWDPHTDIFYNARSSQQNIMVSAHFICSSLTVEHSTNQYQRS